MVRDATKVGLPHNIEKNTDTPEHWSQKEVRIDGAHKAKA